MGTRSSASPRLATAEPQWAAPLPKAGAPSGDRSALAGCECVASDMRALAGDAGPPDGALSPGAIIRDAVAVGEAEEKSRCGVSSLPAVCAAPGLGPPCDIDLPPPSDPACHEGAALSNMPASPHHAAGEESPRRWWNGATAGSTPSGWERPRLIRAPPLAGPQLLASSSCCSGCSCTGAAGEAAAASGRASGRAREGGPATCWSRWTWQRRDWSRLFRRRSQRARRKDERRRKRRRRRTTSIARWESCMARSGRQKRARCGARKARGSDAVRSSMRSGGGASQELRRRREREERERERDISSRER